MAQAKKGKPQVARKPKKSTTVSLAQKRADSDLVAALYPAPLSASAPPSGETLHDSPVPDLSGEPAQKTAAALQALYRNRIVGYGTMRADQYLAHPENARTHPKRQREAVRASLSMLGWVVPVIQSYRSGRLLDGHARIEEVLSQDDQAEIPYCLVDLTEEEEKQFLLLVDRITGLARWDKERLDGLVQTVQVDDEGLKDIIRALASDFGVTVPDHGRRRLRDVGPVQLQKRVQPGQIWEMGEDGHRLLCGSSADVGRLRRLLEPDLAFPVLVLTDPPYGIDRDGVANDKAEGLASLFEAVLDAIPVADDAILCAFQSPRLFPIWLDEARAAGWRFERSLTLYKQNDEAYPWRGWLMQSEICLIHSRGKAPWPAPRRPFSHDVYTYTGVGQELPAEWAAVHPTIKPLDVTIDLVRRLSAPDAIILDPFAGSGTTLIAAARAGRRCLAVELVPDYCDVILARAELDGMECRLVGSVP